MRPQELIVDGVVVHVGKMIGRGGEGEVFALANAPNRALKLYTDGKAADREAKISAMVRRQLAATSTLVAYPVAIVKDRSGRFAGFTMNLVQEHKPLHELCAPGARKQNFPRASYPFLVRTAQNIARAVASVHQSGCVIGDINHSGILISSNATAAVIDADSFQISDGTAKFFCRVGTPEYTPPELQGKKLAGVERSTDHDAFGLAIIIFQLLTMGRHPFIGTFKSGEIPTSRAIAEHRFVYSKLRNVGMVPPPGTCTLDDFNASVAQAFERGFAADGHGRRPTAADWVSLLQVFEASLRPCPANALHHYHPSPLGCPWCRMEARLGIVLFLPTFDVDPASIPAFETTQGGFNLEQLWSEIQTIKIPARNSLKPALPTVTVAPTVNATTAHQLRLMRTYAPYAIYLGALLFALFAPNYWLFAVGLAAAGPYVKQYKSTYEKTLLQQIAVLEHRWNQAIDAWATRFELTKLEKLKGDLQQVKLTYEGLGGSERNKLDAYQHDRRSRQLAQFLESFRIAKATLKGIGPTKFAALASYGIETAADVIRDDVLAVPGFGPVNSKPLFDWRAQCERRFVYDPRPNAQDQREINRIRAETAQSAARLRTELTSGASELWRLAKRCEQILGAQDPELTQLARQWKQLETDASLLGLVCPQLRAVPDPNRIPAPSFAPLRQKRPFKSPASPPSPNVASMMGQPRCPTCGKHMVRRVARRGRRPGSAFWGCSSYPRCRGTRPI